MTSHLKWSNCTDAGKCASHPDLC